MSETQFFISNLLEKWLISYRKGIIQEYEESSEEYLEKVVKENALQSLFLLKRELDPGFRVLIYEN